MREILGKLQQWPCGWAGVWRYVAPPPPPLHIHVHFVAYWHSHDWYRIAGNFWGRKLTRIGEKYDFRWENVRRLLAFATPKDATHPNFTEKTFANSHKAMKFMTVFSPESFLLYSSLSSSWLFCSTSAWHYYVCVCLHDLFVRVIVTTSLSFSLSTEIANGGKPLFPGSDVDEQLKRVFKYPQSSIVDSFPDCFGLVWEWNCIIEGQTHRGFSHAAKVLLCCHSVFLSNLWNVNTQTYSLGRHDLCTHQCPMRGLCNLAS